MPGPKDAKITVPSTLLLCEEDEGFVLQEGMLGAAAVADGLRVSLGERHRGAAAAHQAAEG